MTLRQMKIEDIEQVAEIEKENFSIPWSKKAFQDSLMLGNTIYLVMEDAETVVGYCGMYKVFDEGEIVNVSVRKEHRNMDIGSRMLEELIRRGREQEIAVFFLEVRESNIPAIHLYGKLGFERAGIRKNFYERPVENAIIMWKR